MSLIFLLLSCLGFISLISTSPIVETGEALAKLSSRDLSRSRIAPRDTSINFGEIGATFILGSAESRVSDSGTYPRLTRLSDGGILGVSTYGDGSDKVLRVSRSDDDGNTFTIIGEVARSSGDLDNGFLIQLPSGAILAAFRNHDLDANRAATYYRITVCRSDDGGRTWSFSAQASEHAASGYNGMWEPFLRIGRDGGIQLTWSEELGQNNQETFRAVSHDEGKTWTAPVNLRLHSTSQQFRDGMQGIVSVRDTNGQDILIMVFEVKDGANFYLGTVTSTDDGNTWGSRNTIYRPSQHNAGAPQIASIGNNLAVVFMTDEDTAAGSLNWPGKADIKMIFGTQPRNGQVTWTSQTMHLSEDASYWPGTFQRASNNIMAVYERGGVPYAKIISRG
ncbi:glycoside hydrolase family 93 protein [Hypomontagnella submonticulosa]|nr:glycoside hydrolase family 93 protein [Hypomontagnella submonticulosa]